MTHLTIQTSYRGLILLKRKLCDSYYDGSRINTHCLFKMLSSGDGLKAESECLNSDSKDDVQ